MRFIHIADVHIGAKPDRDYPWGDAREKEIIQSFEDLVHICQKEAIQLLLIAGDLFHRQPLLRELKEINYQFEKIPNTKVVFIAGNHDYIGAKSHYINFTWATNVTMLQGSEMAKVYLEDLDTEVYGFSYHRRNIPEDRLSNVRPDQNEHLHILLSHGGDEKNVPIDLKAVRDLPFDYIALGHIHKPYLLSNKCAYSGSLEPLDKNEIGERGYILGELTKNSCSIQFVPHSFRKYEWLKIDVTPSMTQGAIIDRVKAKINERGCQNIYRVHLNGYKDVDLHVEAQLIKAQGNIIEVLDTLVPDYDFESLRDENKENIIGLYIDKIHESDTEDEIKTKALYYGLEALLNAKN